MNAAPGPVRAVAALVGLEGLGLVALGVVYAVRGLTGTPDSLAGTELGGALIVLAGVLLLLLVRPVLSARRWARSPVLVVQLLALLTGYSLGQGRVWLAAAVLVVLGAAVLGLLATAPARRAFAEDAPEPH